MEEEDEIIHMGNINSASTDTCELNKSKNSSSPNQKGKGDGNQQDHLSLAGRSIADLTDGELLILIKKVMTSERGEFEVCLCVN